MSHFFSQWFKKKKAESPPTKNVYTFPKAPNPEKKAVSFIRPRQKTVSNKASVPLIPTDRPQNWDNFNHPKGSDQLEEQVIRFPSDTLILHDLLIINDNELTGYSLVDHLIISPYGILVITIKDSVGLLSGEKTDVDWFLNDTQALRNPFLESASLIEALRTCCPDLAPQSFCSIVVFGQSCTFAIDLSYRNITSSQLIIYDHELMDTVHRKINILKLTHPETLFDEVRLTQIENAFKEAHVNLPEALEHHQSVMKNNPFTTRKTKKTNVPICVVCNQVVSEKVKAYCLSQPRFRGRIFCYTHQNKF